MEQLKRIGIAPEDIRYVVLSHLHSDHTGAIGRFPHATHVVQRQEYEYAFTLTGLLREPIADAISIVPNLTGYF